MPTPSLLRTLPLLLAALAALPAPAAAQRLTKRLVVDQLPGAAFATSPPGDADRLFVLQLGGRIRVVKHGQLLSTPLLDLGLGGLNKITSGGERGLLGLAFHPDHASNGFFYVDYTDLAGNTVVERYQVGADPDVADPTSGTVVLGPVQQPQSNHNGGCLQFGPDGMLYVALGDGGNFNDQGAGHASGGNAQSGGTLLGKLLRLDVDLPFPHVPADNPFVGDPATLDEIWALGLRNPWRFSFDRQTGELWIGDVGQDAREEINHARPGAAGLNYGWRCMEGFQCTGLSGCTCNAPELTPPVYDYAHTPGCVSVTGGYVYRGCALPALRGTYFFGDYCRRKVWTFELVGGQVTGFADRSAELIASPGFVDSVTSFGEDALGELYLCDAVGGRVYRIEAETLTDCNLNGVADGCDIALGTSRDSDGDGIPDECACSPAPQTYCSAKPNSLGCLPAVRTQGTPKVGNPFPFLIEAHDVLNNVVGILIYGHGAASLPFQGGTLCVSSPRRAPVPLASGGNPGSKTDCSGVLRLDFNAWTASGGDPALVAGAQVNAQFWSRDSADPAGFGTSLSDAVEFVLCN